MHLFFYYQSSEQSTFLGNNIPLLTNLINTVTFGTKIALPNCQLPTVRAWNVDFFLSSRFSPLMVDYHWSDPYPLAFLALVSKTWQYIALGVTGIRKPLHHVKVIVNGRGTCKKSVSVFTIWRLFQVLRAHHFPMGSTQSKDTLSRCLTPLFCWFRLACIQTEQC